jgi:hypothetical protein
MLGRKPRRVSESFCMKKKRLGGNSLTKAYKEIIWKASRVKNTGSGVQMKMSPSKISMNIERIVPAMIKGASVVAPGG